MPKLFVIFLIAGALAPKTAVFAADSEMTAEDIRQDIIGHRVYLAVPTGDEFPLHYKDDGEVSGDGKALGLGAFMAPKETGRWWISGNQLCQQFKTWYNGSQLCFRLAKLGDAKVKWTRDNGEIGMARIAE